MVMKVKDVVKKVEQIVVPKVEERVVPKGQITSAEKAGYLDHKDPKGVILSDKDGKLYVKIIE